MDPIVPLTRTPQPHTPAAPSSSTTQLHHPPAHPPTPQLRGRRAGGPPTERLLGADALAAELVGLDVEEASEVEVQLDEGRRANVHHSPGRTPLTLFPIFGYCTVAVRTTVTEEDSYPYFHILAVYGSGLSRSPAAGDGSDAHGHDRVARSDYRKPEPTTPLPPTGFTTAWL